MKLLTAIVNKRDSGEVCSALSEKNFRFTKIATYGGFLRSKNMTLLIGVEDQDLETALSIIRKHCKERMEKVPAVIAEGFTSSNFVTTEVKVGGATVFVSDVSYYEKM